MPLEFNRPGQINTSIFCMVLLGLVVVIYVIYTWNFCPVDSQPSFPSHFSVSLTRLFSSLSLFPLGLRAAASAGLVNLVSSSMYHAVYFGIINTNH
jgi:hypothetical protein